MLRDARTTGLSSNISRNPCRPAARPPNRAAPQGSAGSRHQRFEVAGDRLDEAVVGRAAGEPGPHGRTVVEKTDRQPPGRPGSPCDNLNWRRFRRSGCPSLPAALTWKSRPSNITTAWYASTPTWQDDVVTGAAPTVELQMVYRRGWSPRRLRYRHLTDSSARASIPRNGPLVVGSRRPARARTAAPRVTTCLRAEARRAPAIDGAAPRRRTDPRSADGGPQRNGICLRRAAGMSAPRDTMASIPGR